MKKYSFVTILFLINISLVRPEQAIELPLEIPGVHYSVLIPKPEEVIGHKIGTRHTRPHQVVEYFRAIAEASDRVIVNQHATSHQGRLLIHAIVTSPANHSRLEEIRQNNLRFFDSPKDVSDRELEKMPGIAYMGYSIHGNEASGTEAAILLLHYLAAGNSAKIDALLEENVIIIDPMLNPDGRDRFVDWVNENRSNVTIADDNDREHNEPWPGGRTNHYWFDLNRDWMPVEHPESNGRIKLFHTWQPQLVMDFHEQWRNAKYFFMPGIPSRNNPNTPQNVFDLTSRMANYLAASLDEIGSLYFTKERFDDFYYGKGSTYPDVNGAVGMLCEQPSSRSLLTETTSGLLTYAFSVRNHFTASLGTLEGFSQMRTDFLKHQRGFFREATSEARKNQVKAYVLSLDAQRTRAQLLVRTLRKHRVQVYKLARQVTVDKQKFIPDKAVIIPMNQPQIRFIKSVMEQTTEFQDSLFYDVSTWTLPLAYGVRYGEVKQTQRSMLGDEIDEMGLDGGKLIGGKASYAYLMEWRHYYSPRALYRMLDAGVYPIVSKEPFEIKIDGTPTVFDRGTIIIPTSQRDAESTVSESDLYGIIQTAIEKDHVVVHSVNTGLVLSGPDLGSGTHAVLKKPTIALLSGHGTASYQVGEIRHLLNEKMKMPLFLIDVASVKDVKLDKYTTLIMVRGSYTDLDSGQVKKLKSWIQGGGTLIAMESAAKWVIENKLIDESLKETKEDTLKVPYNKIAQARGAQRIGGAIFEAKLDVTHPIAFGYNPKVALFRNNSFFFNPSVKPGSNVALYTDNPLLSGYISNEKMDLLKGSAGIIARKSGRGSIILFADNPNFRAFWYGTNGLFLNAIFFGNAL